MSLLNKLEELAQSDMYPFHMPGHKRRLASSKELEAFYSIDITEIDDFDNLNEAEGILKEAKDRAARVFGADYAELLVNGTTVGILAAITGSVSFGDKVIAARNCHKSVYNGVMLSGADLSFIYPDQEEAIAINSGINAKELERILFNLQGEINNKKNGDNIRSLVVITSPTYEGVVSDIKEIAGICHKFNSLLLVDAAHGAHFGFAGDFPESAISLGADIVVTSLHKTLPSPTQTALLLISKSCHSKNQVIRMLRALQTSSPSYVLMSGIDECVRLLENKEERDRLFGEYAIYLNDLYKYADKLENISLLDKSVLRNPASCDFDKGKIVITDSSSRLSGKEIYDYLRLDYKLQPEMALHNYCLMMTSIADTKEAFERLKEALNDIDKRIDSIKVSDEIKDMTEDEPDHGERGKEETDKYPLSMRELMWSKTKWLPFEKCQGMISAGFVVPYPPCVPILIPGEIIDKKAYDRINTALSKGCNINGLSKDKEIEVLWEESST